MSCTPPRRRRSATTRSSTRSRNALYHRSRCKNSTATNSKEAKRPTPEESTVFLLTCHTHIFLRTALTPYFTHFMRVTHTHGSRSRQKGVCRMCVLVLYLAFSLLMSHPSLLFPHGHFETAPDNDFTHDPVHTFLPYFPVLKAQDMRHSAHASRSLATWPCQMQTHQC